MKRSYLFNILFICLSIYGVLPFVLTLFAYSFLKENNIGILAFYGLLCIVMFISGFLFSKVKNELSLKKIILISVVFCSINISFLILAQVFKNVVIVQWLVSILFSIYNIGLFILMTLLSRFTFLITFSAIIFREIFFNLGFYLGLKKKVLEKK